MTHKAKISKREQLSEVVNVRLSKSMIRILDMMAIANRRTRSNQIYVLLSDCLDGQGSLQQQRAVEGK